MPKIEFGQSCLLTRYLEEISTLDIASPKAQFAGALLFELGYPSFSRQLPTIALATYAQSVHYVAAAGESELLSQAAEKCALCPHSNSCTVETLFKKTS